MRHPHPTRTARPSAAGMRVRARIGIAGGGLRPSAANALFATP